MRYFIKWIIILLMISLSLSASGDTKPVQAQVGKPNMVTVGVHLLGIEQLDLYKGSYTMDGHLVFICSQVCPKFTLEVMNGSVESISQEPSTPYQQIYRVKFALHDNFNAANYPFDSYWLRLELKDQMLDKDKLVFVADPKLVFIDPRVILHGWEYNFKVKAIADDRSHPFLKGERFSKFTFMVELRRPLLMGFLKIILPAVIIMFFAFISFFITAEKSLNRLGIVSGALLGSVLFHINITSSFPPIGYLTYIDAFMIISYFMLFIILFENVYVMRLADTKREKFANKIDRVSIYFLPPLWLLLQLLNAFLFFVLPHL